MKSFRELIDRKRAGQGREQNTSKENERYVERLFIEALGKVNKNISRSDIKKFHLKKEILYLQATHPSIASEIWKSRERIRKEINQNAEEEMVSAIKVN
jgi:hypothetical protein